MRTRTLLAGVAALFLAGAASSTAAPPPLGPDLDVILAERPAATLAAYRLFLDAEAQIPSEGVRPYDLSTPLFSDYAEKRRFLFLPPGQRAGYHADGPFSFPVGPVGDKERRIETRLLIRQRAGWTANTYLWSADGREARLLLAGAQIDVGVLSPSGERRAIRYAVPNRNQCKGCHAIDDALSPIGPAAAHFDDVSDGRSESETARWTRIGLLDGAPPTGPARLQASDAKARAYLDINCAHCHNPRGPANTSGLDLRSDQSDPPKFGVRKRPIAAGRASANMAFAIDPGHPERSILLHRMESLDPGVMMPELGRSTVHAEGVELVRAWIAGMDANGQPRPN
jgi:uncharacterized repeat protein (TIGR03806 family)